jgi:hypothetical protein
MYEFHDKMVESMEPQTMKAASKGKDRGGVAGFVYIMDYYRKAVTDLGERAEKKEVVVFGGNTGDPIVVQGYELRREPVADGTAYTVQRITDGKDKKAITELLRNKGLEEAVDFA